jgi:hypothetical protein
MININDATQIDWSTCPEEFLLSDGLDAALDRQVDRASEIISSIPKLPTIKSLDGAALAALLTGNRISHLAFQGDTNSYCLRAPIFNLRELGWPIEDCWNAGERSRFSGKRTKYKKYFIGEENLQRLRLLFGERLKLFIEVVTSLHQKEV